MDVCLVAYNTGLCVNCPTCLPLTSVNMLWGMFIQLTCLCYLFLPPWTHQVVRQNKRKLKYAHKLCSSDSSSRRPSFIVEQNATISPTFAPTSTTVETAAACRGPAVDGAVATVPTRLYTLPAACSWRRQGYICSCPATVQTGTYLDPSPSLNKAPD